MSDLFRDEREGEKMYRAGVSTKLVLYEDPWKIKKELTKSDLRRDVSTELGLYPDPWKIKKELKGSDVGHLSRLLIPRGCVETHVLQWMDQETVEQVESRDGLEVAVWDADTGKKHRLVFRYWASSRSYVLNRGWNKLFVKGRGLNVGDEIGLLWDPYSLWFYFKVLRRVARGTSNVAA